MPHPRARFVLFDPLDAVAPHEVLSAGRDFLGGALDVEFVSAEGPRDVVSGITLTATAALDPAAPGYVVVPGAAGPVDGDPDEVDTIPVLLSRFAASAAAPLLREAGHSRAGRLPRTAVTGERAGA
ncbi:hypothetical protein AB0M80_30865 [Amycolatopsis sp. NPDC051045]|uniref:hypothetical protein n=1 Tax=Amycolatopsis sp. NPDC051045 TaxID=3156922 RepID=UPI003422615B